MVTYIDTKNRAKYQVLFDKAKKTLKEADPSKLSAGIDIENLEITTLNQYFAYLQDLIAVSSNENIKSYFLRLPLDEELFEINANTRAISIPRSFASNGVGVQGDETAEIVYFSIDRYFDHTDLANEDMNIIIQWETRDKDRQIITGISPNFGKDIETIPGKIIFGWPIYSELTESATPIRFAVRFFSLGEADDNGIRALNYSLATLPAEVSVGATIDYDLINKAVKEIDKGKMITGRIKNVGVYDPSVPTPQIPTISTPLSIEGKEVNVKVADLPEDETGTITLKISAYPTDFGAVQYDWRKFVYDSTTGKYAATSESLSSDNIHNNVYEKVSEISNDEYYKVTSAIGEPLTFEKVDIENLNLEKDVNNKYIYDSHLEGFETTEGKYITLYKKYSTATVNSVGIYTVDVGARAGVNTVSKKMDKEDGITIPGPLKPTIEVPEEATEDGIIHIIAQDGTATLTVSARKTEEDEAQVKLSYDWSKIVDNEDVALKGDAYEFNDNKSEVSITGLTASELDEYYRAEVTAERNKVKTAEKSGVYRITNAPEKPILKRIINGKQTISDYTDIQNLVAFNMKRNGVYRKLSFSVVPPKQSDNLSYIWMRLNAQDSVETDWDDNSAKLQVDLDNFLSDLFEDKPGDADIPVDGVFGLTKLTNLGEVIDTADNGPSLSFNDNTPTGIYYCIVVNELNNHRVANVTPFYSVTDN